MAESSFDAWIRYYRPDEDSVNTDVSYYGKGAVLGWCWDAHLRKKSKGKWTLAKLMREFYREFGIDAYESLKGAKPGFTRSELLTFAEEKTGIAQKRLVDSWVVSRKPLPWREAARFFRINWKENVTSPALHFLGMQLKWEGKATVSGVLANGAAETAGIAPFDELIAINGFRVSESEKFKISIKNAMAEGKTLDLLFSRGDKIMNRQLRWRKHDGMGMEVVPK